VVVEWRPEQGAQTVGHFAGSVPIAELIGRRLASE